MANYLKSLTINEVSLVDNPANSSIDPKTGKKRRHATIALWKRDDSEDQVVQKARLHVIHYATNDELPEAVRRKIPDPTAQEIFRQAVNRSITAGKTEMHSYQEAYAAVRDAGLVVNKFNNNKENQPMPFEILKSATSRNQIADAIEAEAQMIAKRDNISEGRAYLQVLEQHPEAYAAYESTAKQIGVYKTHSPVIAVTKAEGRLDIAARKIMKRDPGVSYPTACSRAMDEDPSIYAAYEREAARGEFYAAAENSIAKAANGGGYVDDEENYGEDDVANECPSCEEPTDDGSRFCKNCGYEFAKAGAKSGK